MTLDSAVLLLVVLLLMCAIQLAGLMLNLLMMYRTIVQTGQPRLPIHIKPPQGLPNPPTAAAPTNTSTAKPAPAPAPVPPSQWPAGQPPMPANDGPQPNPFPKFNMPIFRTPPAQQPPVPLTRDGKSITIEPITNTVPNNPASAAGESASPPPVLP